MRNDYLAILHFPHHVSMYRHPMSIHDRAAQFAPFAALTGYDEEIGEAARLTGNRLYMDEERQNYLNECMKRLLCEEYDSISVTYFQPDDKKTGGRYVSAAGKLRRLDECGNLLILSDGTEIELDEIYDIRLGSESLS